MTEFASVSGGGFGVSSLNGQTGALTLRPWVCQHRLTLASATPVMAASQTAKTAHFVTPYQGDNILLFDGTNFIPTIFPETTQATSDTTKSPAAVANNSVYDIFAWNDGGTLRATRGPAWTNDTTRSAGTALVMVNGILLNNAGITNGPNAQRGTYIGSVRSNGTATLDFIYGTSANGGGAATLNVWNCYNRVQIATNVTDSAAGYTYTTATVRQANASTGNQITFLYGLAEDGALASYFSQAGLVAAAAAQASWGIGIDTTTVFSPNKAFVYNPFATATFLGAGTVVVPPSPLIGRHFFAALELGDGANANTFNQGSAATLSAVLTM